MLLHTLPPGLQRIRYYGLLGNRHRAESLARCRELLNMTPCATPPREGEPARDYRSRYEALTGKSLHKCPACLEGCLRLTAVFPRRQLLAVLDTS